MSEQTDYRWRREYGGMKVTRRGGGRNSREHSQLKQIIADQALDNAMLREPSRGSF